MATRWTVIYLNVLQVRKCTLRSTMMCEKTLWWKSTTTKLNASLTTSLQIWSPGDYKLTLFCHVKFCAYILNAFNIFRRTTWAEEKKLNIETFGVPGRFLRGRGFRGRGRRATEQRALPKIGSGRVWEFSFIFLVNADVKIFFLLI